MFRLFDRGIDQTDIPVVTAPFLVVVLKHCNHLFPYRYQSLVVYPIHGWILALAHYVRHMNVYVDLPETHGLSHGVL